MKTGAELVREHDLKSDAELAAAIDAELEAVKVHYRNLGIDYGNAHGKIEGLRKAAEICTQYAHTGGVNVYRRQVSRAIKSRILAAASQLEKGQP